MPSRQTFFSSFRKTAFLGLVFVFFSLLACRVSAIEVFIPDFSSFSTDYKSTTSDSKMPKGTVDVEANQWSLSQSTAGSAANFAYTGGDSSTPYLFEDVRIEVDFSQGASGGSFGIFFANGGNQKQASLLLINLNTSTGADTLRIYSTSSDMTGSGVPSSPSYTDTFTNAKYTLGETYHLSMTIQYLAGSQIKVDYTLSDPAGVLNEVTGSYTFTKAGVSDGEIAFRSYMPSSVAGTNTISAVLVPEPANSAIFIGIVLVSAAGALRFRSRR